jgi:polar amino acid transport system substrate-binding protein
VNYSVYARSRASAVDGLEALRGREIIVQQGTLVHDYLVDQGFDHLVPVRSQVEALRLLASGHQGYAVVGTLAGEHIRRDYSFDEVIPVARIEPTHQICFATLKKNEALLSTFNEGLAIVQRNGRFREIQERWLLERGVGGVPWRLLARYSLVVAFPLLAALGLVVLWSRTLKRQVAARTADLRREIAEREQAEALLRDKQSRRPS